MGTKATGLSRSGAYDEVIAMNDVSVTFDMNRGVSRVLNEVSIDIHRGEILGVVGESGSGKSMFASALLNAIVDPGELSGEIMYYPSSGDPIDVTALEGDALRQFRWEEISMVFQGAMNSFNPTMKLDEHFRETLRAHGNDIEAGMARTRELLTDLHLDAERVLDSYPHELSGGMSQRTLIALSLLLEPEVLVMDEPTAALDLLMQQSILDLLETIRDKYDISIVFVTHDLPLVAEIADRLVVLYAFEIIEYGPADRMRTKPTHPYTRSLLKAVPNITSPLSQMRSIEGTSPDSVNLPSGCSYHPRCPMATEECRETNPSFHDVAEEQQSACFHWDASADRIPLTFDADDRTTESPTRPSRAGDPVVSLDDLSVHFESEASGVLGLFSDPEVVHAVDNVSLDLYENDVVAIVGESGCGKTTLGRTAIAAQRPTEGTVRFREQDIWRTNDEYGYGAVSYDEIRTALQMIHQDPKGALNPNRTVLSSLKVPLGRQHPGMNDDEKTARIVELLERVGISPPQDYARRYPHQLSGGEAQRVTLLRALLMNPDVILADEAVSALDVSLRIEMMDLMLELQSEFDTSYIFISHNLSNARYLAGKAGGRIGVMYLGNIVEIGPPEEIIRNPRHPYTKILKHATTDLDTDSETELPIREIDVPDSTNPPSGCRFHTRCPVGREFCTESDPTSDVSGDSSHAVACFRERDEDHPYWRSESLPGASEHL